MKTQFFIENSFFGGRKCWIIFSGTQQKTADGKFVFFIELATLLELVGISKFEIDTMTGRSGTIP